MPPWFLWSSFPRKGLVMTFRMVPYPGANLLSMLCLMFVIGCGGGTDDGYTGPRGQVSGTITIDGNPIPAGSTVQFQSKTGNTYFASSTVKEGGKYELVYQGVTSLPAVTYLVQISPPVGDGPATAAPALVDPKEMKPFDVKKMTQEIKKDDAKFPFPVRYHSFNTSKLAFDVKAGANTADFKLEK